MRNKRILALVFVVAFVTLLAGCQTTPPIEENQAPIITSYPGTTATVGVDYTYNVNATDPDGDSLIYSLIINPTNMSINQFNGVISWEPTSAQVGDNLVTVKVSDGTLDITQSFTIVVETLEDPCVPPCPPDPCVPPCPPIDENHAPTITSIPGIAAIVGVGYVYDVNALDPDGDALVYSLLTKPDDMTIDLVSGLINWIPTLLQIGDNDVNVEVSDGEDTDTQNFTITVEAVKVIGIEVSPDTMTLLNGGTQFLIVTAHYNNGSTAVVTFDCDYVSNYPSKVSINFLGLVEALSFGKATITVTYTPSGTSFVDTVEVTVGPVNNITQDTYHNTIQAAIGTASADDTIEVSAGTYDEDVTINKSLTLVSTEGKDNTIINGQSTGYAIKVNAGISDVTIGDIGKGFTVNAAGQAALYLQGTNDNITIHDNKIVATINGKCALETSGSQSNHIIADNEFNGIAGPPGQLVYIGGEASHAGSPSTNVNFTNNTFAGTAPTGPALGQEAADSTISGNTFATVTGYASLELWGDDNIVTGNDFTADLPVGEAYVLDSSKTYDLAEILSDNTFLRDVAIVNNEIVVK